LLARLVMERTSHVLLAGPGADAFAREQGVPAVSPESLVTVAARRAWERAVAAQGATAAIAPDVTATRNSKANTNAETDTDTENAPVGHGTVGAVAFDGAHVAAATSTGGTSMKRPGRVGDSPLIGCGTYAWDGAGAVSCTGLGEAIIRAVLGKSAVDLLARGLDPTAAAEQILPRLRPLGGEGGLILVDTRGRLGLAFSTERMAHAWVDVDGNEGVGFRATDDSG
jgi:beta-aspartyl-peptidase (threonine type)